MKSEYDLKYLRPGVTVKNGRYLVGELARSNGEGAVYLGFDNQNGDVCWIREYFPTTISRRHPITGEVSPFDGCEAQFKALISDFVDVCNAVKRLQVTEKVVPIRDAFSDNNTVYAVYEHMDVISFDKYLSQKGGKIPLDAALDMFLPFCHMIGTIHDHGNIHRGISPFTVYVDAKENVYLWDFSLSATRTANSEIKAQLFNGYSAPEQYSANGWQGPWTDVYAVAALFYRTVSGFVPPKSTLVGDDRPLTKLDDLVMGMPKHISDAVSDAMEQQAEKRTQAMYSFTSKLMEIESSGTAVYDSVKAKRREKEKPEIAVEKDGGFRYAALALIFTVVALFCGLLYMTKTYFPSMLGGDESSKPQSHSLSEVQQDPDFIEEDPDSSDDEDQVTVPRFVGQMFSVLESDDAYKGKFEFAVREENNDEFPEGVVFKQTPDPDTRIEKNGTVTLYVSKGAELVTMPNIIGLDYDEALRILGEQDLACDKVERYASGAVAGSVVGTTPAPGADINPKKDKITVYVMPRGGTPEGGQQDSGTSALESSKESGNSKSSSSSKE